MGKQRIRNRGPIERSQRKWGYVFIAPCIIGLIAFNFGPMLFSMGISFTQWNIITPPEFVGLDNYRQMLDDQLIRISLRQTAYYTLLTVPLITIVHFFTAVLLNTGIKGISIFRTVFYIPSIVPIVAASALWMHIFNPMFGLLNNILRMLGLPTQGFISTPEGAVPALSIMAVWAAGNAMVIYLAGLQNVPRQLYEACEIDGGNAVQKFKHITLPLMTPIIFYNVIMAIISSMQVFTQAFIMTNGGPNNATMFFSLLLYQTAFRFGQMGYAAAMSWILFIIIALLTFLVFKTSGRWVFYEHKAD
ncbi:MAG: sugar ABC transporter permease [Oscillospiraceae bacterium]|nr:sugar ABC transporter permease [Oscillospiraceae bacterium]